jgi:alkanesulfonate monooxygenase SsuD/methylene tetrahydromethanopterin reductase-like flavin-dependent oxidoreductase (luciferase family)
VRLGLGVAAGSDPGELADLAVQAEDLGYDSIWSNDSPAGEGLAQLAAWAQGSRHIRLAVGVMALDRHQPADVAQRVRELGIPLDRLLLGLGAGFTSTPLATVRAGVEGLREALPGVRVAVAAMGPRMCGLAGEVGDAVLLNWMTPARAAWARGHVDAGAAAAGRGVGAVTVFGYVRTALGADAGERLRRESAMYLQMPQYARHFAAMAAPPDGVGVTATEASSVAAGIKAYGAIDEPVVRVLSHRSVGDVMAVARAAIGA